FTRRTFMKTTALTIGAVALLSQGRALADGGGSSSVPWLMPGIERFQPLSVLDFPDPLSKDVVDGEDNVIAILRGSITSQQADFACRVRDAVEYLSTAELYHPDGVTKFPLGGEVSDARYFGAYRSGNLIPVAEIWADMFEPNNCSQDNSVEAGYEIQLAGETVKLFVETTRVAPVICPTSQSSPATATVKMRGVLKKKVDGDFVEFVGTSWVSRTTQWRTCEFDGNASHG
ncbi:MAG: hypothetical protein WCK77_25400, partial [Verrucomicrobiota bacterium]